MTAFKIRFINSDDFVGRAIDWVTNSIIDHTEIETETGTYIGAHAGTGIQERSATWCVPTWERRYSIPCTDAQLEQIMSYARSKIGTPYDYIDVAGLLLHDRALKSPDRLICSAFVFNAALAGGVMMLNVSPNFSALVTPEILHLSPLLIGNCTYHYYK